MKKHLVCLLSLLSIVGFILGGCSSSTESSGGSDDSDELTIGFQVYGLKAEFATALKDSIEKEAEKRGVKLNVLDGKYDVNTAISQLQNLQTQQVDAIIISPIDPDALKDTVNSVADSGIPVISVIKMDAENLTSFVGSPDIEAGEMVAEQMVEAIDGKGNVVIFDGPIGQYPQIARKEGIFNVLDKHKDINVLEEKTANWSRDEGMSLMENWIQSYGDEIDGVIGQNDEMALGAKQALIDQGMGDVPIVGVDGVKDALEAVKSGEQYATIYQSAIEQGKKSLEIAIKAAKGEDVEETYLIPFELVTKENVDEYLNE
ncbi:substrate-binding domain-containing protein [Virgibacillus sp. CBA3643]|uniref:substrate-binding domain-containing protein n=1 Tax=Virgibacillus sp. CBA3643 TaxID=2942278 RepID=UPI0035A2D193